jgi:hypothetical protein
VIPILRVFTKRSFATSSQFLSLVGGAIIIDFGGSLVMRRISKFGIFYLPELTNSTFI